MPKIDIKWNKSDIRAFKRAIKQNPLRTRREATRFFTKAKAEFQRKINRNPWEIGQSGGGAPVDTGRLRDTHRYEQRPWALYIFPTANYAWYVHEGTSRMEERPWMDYAFREAKDRVKRHADDMLEKLVKGLAD